MRMYNALKKDILKYLKELSKIEEKRGNRSRTKDTQKAIEHFIKAGEIKAAISEVEKF